MRDVPKEQRFSQPALVDSRAELLGKLAASDHGYLERYLPQAARRPAGGDHRGGMFVNGGTVESAEAHLIDAPTRSDGGTHGPRTRMGGRRHASPEIDAARLLSVPEAAIYLGLSYWTVRDLVAAGTVPSVKVPAPRARDGRTVRRTLVDRRDLDSLVETWKERSQ